MTCDHFNVIINNSSILGCELHYFVKLKCKLDTGSPELMLIYRENYNIMYIQTILMHIITLALTYLTYHALSIK